MNRIEIASKSAEQTQQIAKKIGKNLQGGECIELVADVGGGKTTFVRGLAYGAGSNNHISSPSYTISKVYNSPKFDIVHFDFYRLKEAGLTGYNIEEEIADSSSVIVVEWSDVIKHILPDERLVINILVIDDNSRIFNIKFPSQLAYLLAGVE